MKCVTSLCSDFSVVCYSVYTETSDAARHCGDYSMWCHAPSRPRPPTIGPPTIGTGHSTDRSPISGSVVKRRVTLPYQLRLVSHLCQVKSTRAVARNGRRTQIYQVIDLRTGALRIVHHGAPFVAWGSTVTEDRATEVDMVQTHAPLIAEHLFSSSMLDPR